MNKRLSPAAQAVLGAYAEHNGGAEGMLSFERRAIAAALRAVADQVAPEDFCVEPLYWSSDDYEKGQEIHNAEIRSQILAIAAELEGTSPRPA